MIMLRKEQQKNLKTILDENLSKDLLNWNNFIWHGVVGAEIIKNELQIKNEEILNAVRRHTVGDVEMTTLDKIICRRLH